MLDLAAHTTGSTFNEEFVAKGDDRDEKQSKPAGYLDNPVIGWLFAALAFVPENPLDCRFGFIAKEDKHFLVPQQHQNQSDDCQDSSNKILAAAKNIQQSEL